MIETICAFANSEGGLLVIGVGDAKDLKSGAKPQNRLFGIEENPRQPRIDRPFEQKIQPPQPLPVDAALKTRRRC